MKKASGFTLVELLVVIVIIGILSTITVGTFRGHFSKARDAKRVAAINSVDLMMRTEFADTWDDTKRYITDATKATAMLQDNEMVLKSDNDFCYVIASGDGATASADDNQYVVAGWSEKNQEVIVKGSPDAVKAVEALTTLTESTFRCKGTKNNAAALIQAVIPDHGTTKSTGTIADGTWKD